LFENQHDNPLSFGICGFNLNAAKLMAWVCFRHFRDGCFSTTHRRDSCSRLISMQPETWLRLNFSWLMLN